MQHAPPLVWNNQTMTRADEKHRKNNQYR